MSRNNRFLIASVALTISISSQAFAAGAAGSADSASTTTHDVSTQLSNPSPNPSEPSWASPLSSERLSQFDSFYRDYDMRSRYGLLDHSEQYDAFNSINGQRNSVIMEFANRQANENLKTAKSNVELEAQHSAVAKSILVLSAAYLIYNGKPVTTHLTQSTDLSASAKGAEHSGSVSLSQKNVTPLNIISGVDYHLDGGSASSVTASLSKEVVPHVVASVDQRRDLSAASNESTGKITFGTSF